MFAIFSQEELLTLIYYKMVSYKELGLVNTKEMFAKAIKGGYAIPLSTLTIWNSYRLLSRLLLKPNRR